MLGLDHELARGELFGELVPAIVGGSGVDAVFVPSAPCGGDQPFRPGSGVGTYYGVGCYELGLEDARRAEVRFAAECSPSHTSPARRRSPKSARRPALRRSATPLWKAGIPREHGADWDFEDVRDHYLKSVFGVDAAAVRHVDRDRYLELSRALTGEILGEVFGEWRRQRSPCAGRSCSGGTTCSRARAGGSSTFAAGPRRRSKLDRARARSGRRVDDRRAPRRLAIHSRTTDRSRSDAQLRVATYRDRAQLVDEATVSIELAAHETPNSASRKSSAASSTRLGHTVSRPRAGLVVVSLERDGAAAFAGDAPSGGLAGRAAIRSRLGLAAQSGRSGKERSRSRSPPTGSLTV